ncbi:MAG TPA: glycerophosphodiester phosphodiesterase family protein [Gaiellaceae bacterium]|nr:glycerophosphodiester phosphodiesterase family protein [Gaiellaceae bacterium]
MGRPLAIAHRGDPHAHRENTLAAFAAATASRADMLELDLRLTADGRVVVLHDRTLERLWGLPRAVAELTLAEVQDCGEGDVRVPSLEDVLDAEPGELMLDYVDDDVVAPALAVLDGAGALERVVFAGENLRGHRCIREREPDARIALTWTSREAVPDSLLDELAPEYLNPEWQLVTAELVARMHERGTGVSTWTVDEPETMARLLDLGVDAVITNRVELLVSLLDERAGAPC